MVQQLVMTPQLQQAIKLLQLSHMEMADVLQAELEQNPVLEEPNDGSDEGPEVNAESNAETEAAAEADGMMGLGATPDADNPSGTELALPGPAEQSEIVTDIGTVLTEAPAGSTPEPTSNEVEREIDWESYLDTYSYSLPASAGGRADDELPPFEATMTKSQSLHDHLRWQVQLADLSAEENQVAAMLIEEINEDGYLAPEAVALVADELDVSVDDVETVVRELQTFEPTGVAARNLRECLLIQVRERAAENPLLVEIIDKHLHQVERRNYLAIAKELKVPVEAVTDVVKLIGHLEPRPGRSYSDREPQYITPDIYVVKVGDDYAILLNEDGLPKLRISNYYREAMAHSGGNTKSFIQEKLRSAVWLIRSIHMRQRTIYRVMESILKFQHDFFERGPTALKPLILKDVAEDVGMHESTISRVTTNKYVHTPQGIYELKYFFNSSIAKVDGDAIASESVRNHIEKLIREESPKSPLSDQQIVEVLKKQNIDIARRTVAKYREMLRIPSSSKRKRTF